MEKLFASVALIPETIQFTRNEAYKMKIITENFYEWGLVALAFLNFIVILKSKDRLTLSLTLVISLLIASTLFIKK